jgi:hypothetical protein
MYAEERLKAEIVAENAVVADWLVRLTNKQRNWGFGLCFLYLRNVKGFKWSHKRVYRIDRELELNLRIKPRRRLVREKPLPLAMPAQINETWSMDFMHDHSSMLISSAITARCATTGWPITSLKRSRRSRTLQPAGCGLAITPGPTWHLAAPHQEACLGRLSSTFSVLLKWGDYHPMRPMGKTACRRFRIYVAATDSQLRDLLLLIGTQAVVLSEQLDVTSDDGGGPSFTPYRRITLRPRHIFLLRPIRSRTG